MPFCPRHDRRRSAFRNAVAGVLATAGLAATLGPAAAQDLGRGIPAITVTPEFLDFGLMERNQTRQGEFIIRNDGGADLLLREVGSSCGCTVAQPEVKSLKPGATTKLKVTFNSKEFQGPQDKTVTIFSNDPATPHLELSVRATVHVPIQMSLDRPLIGFGRFRRGAEGIVNKIYMASMDTKELKLKPVRFPADLVTVTVEPDAGGDPAKAVLVVRVKKDARHGPFNDVIRVETNVPAQPVLDFELTGDVLQDLTVHPGAVNFRYVERDQNLRTYVFVRPASEKIPFKVTGAEIDLPEFRAKIEEKIPDRETMITLTGRPLPVTDPRVVAAEGRMQGTLRIRTNLPEQPEILVKVTYLLKL